MEERPLPTPDNHSSNPVIAITDMEKRLDSPNIETSFVLSIKRHGTISIPNGISKFNTNKDLQDQKRLVKQSIA